MHTVFVACRARFQLGQPVPRGSDRMSFRPGSKKLYFLSKSLLLPGGNEQEKKNGYNKNCSSPFFFAVVTLS